MRTLRWPFAAGRRLLMLAAAVAALAGASAVRPAQAQGAPCGAYTGNKCVEVEWCLPAWPFMKCGTKVLSYYRAAGEEAIF